jgi:hypothetical protein
MGPAIGSQMTLIGAVLGGLSRLCSDSVGRRRAFVQWYTVRQSCCGPDKQYGRGQDAGREGV